MARNYSKIFLFSTIYVPYNTGYKYKFNHLYLKRLGAAKACFKDWVDGSVGCIKFFNLNYNSFIGHYKDGKLEGPWYTYRDNGKLEFGRVYKKGFLHGIWEEYDEEGNLARTRTYKNGNY